MNARDTTLLYIVESPGYAYNEYMAHHYAFMMKVAAEQELERPSLRHRIKGRKGRTLHHTIVVWHVHCEKTKKKRVSMHIS